MHWTEEQKTAIERYTSLEDIPAEERRYKCYTCHRIVDEEPCPSCGETALQLMCPVDHCHCPHDIVESLAYCPLCSAPICPECGTHDVSQISRITGYLSDVTGWNAAKQQELRDRAHYDIG